MKKIAILCLAGLLSLFFGLFILPLDVETTRWITLSRPEEAVWTSLNDPNFIWRWSEGNTTETIRWIDNRSSFEVTEVKAEEKEIFFVVKDESQQEIGDGKIFLENIPLGLWLRCEYSYPAEYSPFARLGDWLRRGDIAIQIDKGLLRMKEQLEQNEAQ